jgi:outer membrane protein assembly factor BamB
VGTGFSSLAVAEGRLFTLGNAEDTQTLWCLDADTGAVRWSYSYPEPLDPNLFEGGPTSTPAVAGDAVYTFSRRGLVLCCDAATGQVRWQVDLPTTCGVSIPTWGFASSPVVVEDRVLLGAGRHGVALDRRTGKVLWQSDNEEDAAYATPVLAEWGGIPTALILSAKSLHAVEVRTGALRWEHRWVTRYGVNAADPLVQGDSVWLSSGYAKGAALLRVAEGGNAAVELFRTRELRNQMAPGVLIDGHVYAVDGDAGDECALKCLELTSGQVRWSQEGLGMATLIAVGTRLVVLSESGELLLAPATPEGFAPTARATVLTGKCWTPPAFAQGRLYCRNAAGEVVCLDLRP